MGRRGVEGGRRGRRGKGCSASLKVGRGRVLKVERLGFQLRWRVDGGLL